MMNKVEYINVQNVVRLHACTLSVAFSTRWWPRRQRSAADCSRLQSGAALAHRHCSYDIHTLSAAQHPRPYNPPDSGLGCLVVSDQDQWSPAFLAVTVWCPWHDQMTTASFIISISMYYALYLYWACIRHMDKVSCLPQTVTLFK